VTVLAVKTSPVRKVDHLIVHCSASSATANIGAKEITEWHKARGWRTIGYHYVIRRNGKLELGRPVEEVGAHVGDCGPGWNTRSVGVCLVGGVNEQGKPTNNFTDEQFDTLEWVLLFLLKKFPGSAVMGHRDLIKLTKAPPKDCPSFDVTSYLKERNIHVA
jgi:N-acetyl-anhydromuramyl-L-alanine amidase AmpD